MGHRRCISPSTHGSSCNRHTTLRQQSYSLTPKVRITVLLPLREGNPSMTDGFPSIRDSNADRSSNGLLQQPSDTLLNHNVICSIGRWYFVIWYWGISPECAGVSLKMFLPFFKWKKIEVLIIYLKYHKEDNLISKLNAQYWYFFVVSLRELLNK